MTPEQENHLRRMKREFCRLADPKYRVGASEHVGNLFDQPAGDLLDSAIAEALDGVIYLLTIRDVLSGIAAGEISAAAVGGGA